MRDIKISGNHNTLYIGAQQDLNLETKSELVSVRFYPTEYKKLKALADLNNAAMSDLVRRLALKYLKAMPHLNELQKVLDEIV